MAEPLPALVDTHAHLMDEQFAADRDQVLARAAEAGVVAIVCVGYDLASSRAAVDLAERFPQLVATVGVHPNYAAQAGPGDFETIAALARHPRVVAVGETGLDHYRQFTPPELQLEWLRRHLRLAAETGLPVVIHCRDAAEAVGEELEAWAATLGSRERPPGVLHCFAGDERLAARCTRWGFLLSFAGPLTFRREGALVDAARRATADQLVVETDSPYLAPAPRRGQRNEPAWVRLTFTRIAEVRGAEPAALARQTTRNAARLFGLDPLLE